MKSTRVPSSIYLSLILLAIAVGAAADVPDVEKARADLIRFTDQLRDVPGVDPAAAETARANIVSAPADDVMSLHAIVGRDGGWKLPQLAAGLSREDAECARAELIRFTEQFNAVADMDPEAAENARRSIATAPAEVIVPMYAALQRIKGWQELPAVVTEISRKIETYQSERIKRIVEETINGARNDPEQLRMDLLLFVSMLRAFTPVAAPDLNQHLDFLEGRITVATPGELGQIRKILGEKVNAFRDELNTLRPGYKKLSVVLTPTTTSHSCGHICEDDPFGICDSICNAVMSAFNAVKSALETAISGLTASVNTLQAQVNDLVSQVTSLTNQVAGFVNQIAGFVTSAFEATANMFTQLGQVIAGIGATFENLFNEISSVVTGFFNDLIALVPTTPEEAFNLLTGIQLTSTAWVDTLISRFPILEPPCPAFGTDVGPLGVVGTLAATQKAEGLAKLTKILYDAAPSDAAGLPVKLKVAAIYHPAEYWSLCARSRYAIAQFDALSAHRNLESTNLNVQLSTRATQTSVVALGVSVSDVDGDVARTESKLNLLAPKTDELLRRLDQPLSTRAKQTSINDLRGTLGNLDRDVAKVESKLDILQTSVRQEASNEADFQADVAAFEALMTRLAIEDNLLESNPNVISLFQLPATFGGHLSLVRSVVEQTINAMLATGQPIQNAQNDLGRGDALIPVGDFAGAFKEFRKAYSAAVKP